MYCIKCGKEMPAAGAYCEFCGAPQQPQQSSANNNQFYTEQQFNSYGESRAQGEQPKAEQPQAEQTNQYGYYGGFGGGGYAAYPQPDENDLPMTVGGWIKTQLILMIPLVNIIMVFVWAFGDGNKSRKNYFRAQLLLTLIITVLFFVLALFAGIGAGMSGASMENLGI